MKRATAVLLAVVMTLSLLPVSTTRVTADTSHMGTQEFKGYGDGKISIDSVFLDPIFAKELKTEKYDTNMDGYLSDSEIANIKEFEYTYFIQFEDGEDSIKSLTGIEYLTSLETLDITGCQIASGDLDLSNCYSLKKVSCAYCNLTYLTLPDSPQLTYLDCAMNENMKSLNLYRQTYLKTLDVSYCALTALDLKKNVYLEELNVIGNRMDQLDISRTSLLNLPDKISKVKVGYQTDASNNNKALELIISCKQNCYASGLTDSGFNKMVTVTASKHAILTKTPAVLETSTEYGCMEYNQCYCGKYFSDSACEKMIGDGSEEALNAWKADEGRIHSHTYNNKIVDDKYLISAANCKTAAMYAYSCRCGAYSTSKTFYNGTKTNTHGNITLETEYYMHKYVCDVCEDIVDSDYHEDLNLDNVCDVCATPMPGMEDCFYLDIPYPEGGTTPDYLNEDGTDSGYILMYYYEDKDMYYYEMNSHCEDYLIMKAGEEVLEMYKAVSFGRFEVGKEYSLLVALAGDKTNTKPLYYKGRLYPVAYEAGSLVTNISLVAKEHTHKFINTLTKASNKADGKLENACKGCGEVSSTTVIPKIESVGFENVVITYDGTVKHPELVVKDSAGKTLTQGTDYTVSYSDGCIEVGVYTATVEFMGNYEGSQLVNYAIIPAVNQTATPVAEYVKLEYSEITYDGTVKHPAVVAIDSAGQTLTQGTDYTVSYSEGSTDVGAYTAAVTFKGKYEGTKTLNYSIVPDSSATAELKATGITYTGKNNKPVVIVKNAAGNELVNGKDYIVNYPDKCKNIGGYELTVSFMGNYTGSRTLSFTVNPKGTTIKSLKSTKKGLKVTLKKQKKQTSGYEIQYATSPMFLDAKQVVLKKSSIVSATIKKLKKGKTYYVSVRTFKKVGKTRYYSSWSKVKKVIIK